MTKICTTGEISHIDERVREIVIHSDGGCRGNPGPGGWGVVLTSGPHRRELSGAVAATTNNRMELQAAIEGLRALRSPSRVTFFTDSQYVKNGVSKWMPGWKRQGWRLRSKKPLKNVDLWQALDEATAPHQITWYWVKGHSGQAENERCDVLANAAMDQLENSHSRENLAAELKAFQDTVNSCPSEPTLALEELS